MKINIHTQPDDVTCGPTCLQALYDFYNDKVPLSKIVQQVKQTTTGGTLAPYIGHHALKRGYNAKLYVYNLDMFDPTWFIPQQISANELVNKLKSQAVHERSKKFQEATKAYIRFLQLGGQIAYNELNTPFLNKLLNQNIPILTGLNSTYLYQCMRERENWRGEVVFDDVRGEPTGHFVLLSGYDENRHVVIADPHRENPISNDNYYKVPIQRLVAAILLGVLTFDGNLLMITPR